VLSIADSGRIKVVRWKWVVALLKRGVELPMYTKSAGNGKRRFPRVTSVTAKWWEPMDKIRALIVDDSSVMRKIVERSLRQGRYRN
jgi:hypothetical protein